jgi:hypoxanthine phosphoribosyltransferase
MVIVLKIAVKVVTWDDVVKLSTSLARKVRDRGYDVDIIVAIARGGLVPARIVADVLGVMDVLSIKVEHWVETASHTPQAKVKYDYKLSLQGKKVLIIDDITDTGDSMQLAKDYVMRNFAPLIAKTATMQHISTVSKSTPDFYAEEVKDWTWFMYPWNYWEDMINLLGKIIKEKGHLDEQDLEGEFKESYGISPPIPIKDVLDEMKHRGKL